MRTTLLPLFAAATLTACYDDIPESDPRHPETVESSAWLKQLKAEDRDTATLLAQQCHDEGAGGFFTGEGVLELARCMRRKYDEGVRWVPEDGPAEAGSAE